MDSHVFDWRGYGLGELPPAEMAECERHLGSCAQCRTEAEPLAGDALGGAQSAPGRAASPHRFCVRFDPA